MTSQAPPADDFKVSDDAVAPLQPAPNYAGDPVVAPASRAAEMGGRDTARPTPADPEAAASDVDMGGGRVAQMHRAEFDATSGAENRSAVAPGPAKTKVMPGDVEVGGRDGPEPTRYGDWELRGRCIDF